MDKNKWYKSLLKEINEMTSKSFPCLNAFVHGQVFFAFTAGLITSEEMKELSDMIPEY